jgi:hypothetical protein
VWLRGRGWTGSESGPPRSERWHEGGCGTTASGVHLCVAEGLVVVRWMVGDGDGPHGQGGSVEWRGSKEEAPGRVGVHGWVGVFGVSLHARTHVIIMCDCEGMCWLLGVRVHHSEACKCQALASPYRFQAWQMWVLAAHTGG